MRVIIYNKQMLETVIADMRNEFEKHKRLNVVYEKSHKERTMAQVGFLFAALINQITEFFNDCGFNVDSEDVRYKLYDDVSKIVPEIVVDRVLFGGKPRVKHVAEMNRELMSKFIDGVFQVIDQDPIYSGLQLHPSVYINWAYHVDNEELKQAQTATLPERDADYLNYQRTCPCIICGIQHRSQAHHAKIPQYVMVGKKSPDFCAIPLCYEHHINGAHKFGHQWLLEQLSWIPLDLLDFCRISYIRWKNKR